MRRIGIALAVCATLVLALAACAASPNWKVPAVALVDDRGAPFTFSQLQGTTYALFFGYTHCPDTCPATLAKLERARTALPSPAARAVKIVFVTVDPARDTPAVLHQYVELFGPGIVGVTGTAAALKTLYDALHVWSVRIGKGPNYAMGHTATIFFVDGSGRIRTLHDWQDSPADLTRDLKELIQ